MQVKSCGMDFPVGDSVQALRVKEVQNVRGTLHHSFACSSAHVLQLSGIGLDVGLDLGFFTVFGTPVGEMTIEPCT